MNSKKRPKRAGTLLMTVGLLLVAAALFLTVYNLWDERRAAGTVTQTLEEMGLGAEVSHAVEARLSRLASYNYADRIGLDTPNLREVIELVRADDRLA